MTSQGQGEEVAREGRALVGILGQGNEIVTHTDVHRRKVYLAGHREDSLEETGGRRCVQKVMMVEETVFDEIETCDHSYDKKCLTSYITQYKPFQEEECVEQFKKSCFIKTEKKSVTEVVEVCKTPMVKDCDIEGEEVCHTVYESECWTKHSNHEVRQGVVMKLVMVSVCRLMMMLQSARQSWRRSAKSSRLVMLLSRSVTSGQERFVPWRGEK